MLFCHQNSIMLMLLLLATVAFAEGGGDTWKLRLVRNEISVYSNKIPGSPIDELKGECVLDAPLEVVAQVMLDVPAYPEWVADCREARKFDCTDLTTCKLYFTLDMPWPVRDRDIVLRSSTEIFMSEGRIVGTVDALSEELVPKQKNRVRITSMYGKWFFERISPDKTAAAFVCWADPAGYVPPFIVNLASLDIPYRTLLGLKAMVKKEAYIRAALECPFPQTCPPTGEDSPGP